MEVYSFIYYNTRVLGAISSISQGTGAFAFMKSPAGRFWLSVAIILSSLQTVLLGRSQLCSSYKY